MNEIREKLLDKDDSIPRELMKHLIRKADHDKDGHLSYDEFIRLVKIELILNFNNSKFYSLKQMQIRQRHLTRFQKLVRGAVSTVIPRGTVNIYGEDVVDGYIDHYNCRPPPIFMILISAIELIIFIVYAVILHKKGIPGNAFNANKVFPNLNKFFSNISNCKYWMSNRFTVDF